MTRPAEMGDPSTLPSLFRAADASSARSQKEFLYLTALGFAALTVAGASGLLESWPVHAEKSATALVGAIAFSVALVLRSFTLSSRPERGWYDGRALAESAKSLAWRYAVRAHPFPENAEAPDQLFARRIAEIAASVHDVYLEPEVESAEELTSEMRRVRGLELQERRGIYQEGRIEDQRRWYAARALRHAGRARVFGYVSLGAEAVGIAFGLLAATGTIELDLLPLLASVSAGLIGWERARQDTTLARAYSVAAQELAAISGLVDTPQTPGDWSEFVGQAEEAISREHTLWLVSRSP